MSKFLILATGIFMFASAAHAGQNIRRLPDYQNIDLQARTSLQKCLDDKTNSIEHCVHKTKKMLKHEKKKLKHPNAEN